VSHPNTPFANSSLLEPKFRIVAPVDPHSLGIFGLSVSPDGKRICVMDLDGIAYLYELTSSHNGGEDKYEYMFPLLEPLTMRDMRHFDVHTRQAFACTLCITDTVILVNSIQPGTINVFDILTGQLLVSTKSPLSYPP
jgi:WD40 repeat protein